MQTFSILLWRGAERSPTEFPYFSENAFHTICIYNELPSQYRPNYLTAKSKKEVKEMYWELDRFQMELLKTGERDGQKAIDYSDLGYSISFFSSFEKESSFGYSLRIGNTNKHFFNTIVIHVAPSFNMFDLENTRIIKDIFIRSVKEFRPIWGCISNSDLRSRTGSLFLNGLPKSLHWINYWSPEVVAKVSSERIQTVKLSYPQVMYNNGFLQIQEAPIDSTKIEEVTTLNAIEKMMFDD